MDFEEGDGPSPPPARIRRLTRGFPGTFFSTLRRTSVSLFSQQLGWHFYRNISCVNVFHLCLALLINEMKLNESGSHAIGLVMQENNPKGLPINTCIFYSYYLLTELNIIRVLPNFCGWATFLCYEFWQLGIFQCTKYRLAYRIHFWNRKLQMVNFTPPVYLYMLYTWAEPFRVRESRRMEALVDGRSM